MKFRLSRGWFVEHPSRTWVTFVTQFVEIIAINLVNPLATAKQELLTFVQQTGL
jgi:hypothetical protein